MRTDPRGSSIDDPRTIVTEHAFWVSPAVVGSPLASPRRRAAAMLIDGSLIALLANAPGVLFGVAMAVVLLRVALKPATGGLVRRSVGRATRGAAAAMCFLVSLAVWDAITERGARDEDVVVEDEAEAVTLSGLQGLSMGREWIGFVRSNDEAESRRSLQVALTGLREAGVSDAEVIGIMRDLPESFPDRPWLRAAADSVIASLAAEVAVEPGGREGEEELLSTYVAALQSGDSALLSNVRPRLVAAFSRDTVALLTAALQAEEERTAGLRSEVDELEEELDEGAGIIASFRSLMNDLGLGLGWSGLYFTAFVVLWQGRTPGKRMLGLRVVRLDNRPIGWWSAFERFAGYAAGLATGLLGFLQIYWDRNRQAVHDKISATVVVRD